MAVYAPSFQTLVDEVCTNLDKTAHLSGAGRRYRAAPSAAPLASLALASRPAPTVGGSAAAAAAVALDPATGAAAPHGLLFGGGGAPSAGPSFALFAHLSGGGSLGRGGGGAEALPSLADAASEPTDRTAHDDAALLEAARNAAAPVLQRAAAAADAAAGAAAGLVGVGGPGSAPLEGWGAALGALAGGLGSFERSSRRVERLERLAAHGSQRLVQEFCALSQQVPSK